MWSRLHSSQFTSAQPKHFLALEAVIIHFLLTRFIDSLKLLNEVHWSFFCRIIYLTLSPVHLPQPESQCVILFSIWKPVPSPLNVQSFLALDRTFFPLQLCTLAHSLRRSCPTTVVNTVVVDEADCLYQGEGFIGFSTVNGETKCACSSSTSSVSYSFLAHHNIKRLRSVREPWKISVIWGSQTRRLFQFSSLCHSWPLDRTQKTRTSPSVHPQ